MFLFLPLLVVDILLSLFINMDKVQFVDNTLPLEVLAFLRSFASRSLQIIAIRLQSRRATRIRN